MARIISGIATVTMSDGTSFRTVVQPPEPPLQATQTDLVDGVIEAGEAWLQEGMWHPFDADVEARTFRIKTDGRVRNGAGRRLYALERRIRINDRGYPTVAHRDRIWSLKAEIFHGRIIWSLGKSAPRRN